MYLTNYRNIGIMLFIGTTLVFAIMFSAFDDMLHRSLYHEDKKIRKVMTGHE